MMKRLIRKFCSQQVINGMPELFLHFLLTLQSRVFVPVTIYHNVDTISYNPLTSNKIHTIEPNTFYDQISLLKKYYKIIPLDEFVIRIKNGKRITKTAVITFDDGYYSVLKNAVPILNDLNVHATFFITTKLLYGGSYWRDKVRYIINKHLVSEFLNFANEHTSAFSKLTIECFYKQSKSPKIIASNLVEEFIDKFLKHRNENIKYKNIYTTEGDLSKQRFTNLTFGNHTHNHYVLSSLSRDDQYKEIKFAEDCLQKLTIPVSKIFSIPFGDLNTFNDTTLEIVKDMGYQGYLVSSGIRNCVINRNKALNTDLIALNRFMPTPNKRFLISDFFTTS